VFVCPIIVSTIEFMKRQIWWPYLKMIMNDDSGRTSHDLSADLGWGHMSAQNASVASHVVTSVVEIERNQ
jgi:hypothetical protein